MRDFAFIQTSPGRALVGWGPFEQLPFRRPERPAFYVSDFFLDDVHPWRHPATWEELSFEELATRFPEEDAPVIEWEPPSLDEFTRLFESAREAMLRGDFNKIVPVLFENGRFVKRGNWWRYFFEKLVLLPPGLRAYGYSHHQHGMIGAPSPIERDDGKSAERSSASQRERCVAAHAAQERCAQWW